MTTKGPENVHTTTPSGRLDLGGMGVGLMQWGTTSIDNNIVNPKGNFAEADVRRIWESCREHNIVFFGCVLRSNHCHHYINKILRKVIGF